jgi:hypothetical protein
LQLEPVITLLNQVRKKTVERLTEDLLKLWSSQLNQYLTNFAVHSSLEPEKERYNFQTITLWYHCDGFGTSMQICNPVMMNQ